MNALPETNISSASNADRYANKHPGRIRQTGQHGALVDHADNVSAELTEYYGVQYNIIISRSSVKRFAMVQFDLTIETDMAQTEHNSMIVSEANCFLSGISAGLVWARQNNAIGANQTVPGRLESDVVSLVAEQDESPLGDVSEVVSEVVSESQPDSVSEGTNQIAIDETKV